MANRTDLPVTPLSSVEALKQTARRRSHLKGRQVDESARQELRALVGETPLRRDLLIEYLHRLNDHFRALFKRHLVALAAEMKIGMAEVMEVATFYHHFSVLEDDQIAPEHVLRVCDGLSCQLAGSQTLLNSLQARCQGSGTRVEAAPCVGRCEQAPVAVLDQRPFPRAEMATLWAAVQSAGPDTLRHEPAAAAADGPSFNPATLAERAVTACRPGAGDLDIAPAVVDFARYRQGGGYVLAQQLSQGLVDPQTVIGALSDSGLRGLGGAGFPAGRKWGIVREQAAPRLMAVNIDEGEPGTFKDRTYLERDPHRFLEGVIVAAQVVGISSVYIYLRDEDHGARAVLEQALADLADAPPCPLPAIELRRGAGAYICGEESAMIESIEGKRGEPRMRPPYIAQVGLFGRPTLEHNFETLYWVRDIVQRGATWFSSFGRHGRHGLRSFSVSGRVKSPGVKLAPAGITVQELIDEYCGGMQEGHRFYAYLPGGASGGILPARLNQIPLDFDTLQPHGCFIGSAAVMILSEADRARDAALNVMRFFEHESCGQCTPCRVGTTKAAQLMAAPIWDADTLNDLADVMGDASICGLGQAAPNPIRSVLTHFAHEIDGQGLDAPGSTSLTPAGA